MSASTPKTRRSAQAFTLIELLVATAISLLVIVMLTVVVQSMLRHYQEMKGNAVVEREGGLCMNLLVNDLEAIARPTGDGAETLRIVREKADIAEVSRLYALSSALDLDTTENLLADGSSQNQQNGVPRAIVYRVAYDDPIAVGGGNPSFGLYRSVAGGEETFQKAVGSTNLATVFPADKTALLENYLAGHVIRFDASLLVGGNWVSADSVDDVLRVADGEVFLNGTAVPGNLTAIRVSMTLIPRQAEVLRKAGALTLEEIIRRFGREYVAQTRVASRSL